MTMMANALLNRVIDQNPRMKPGAMLEELHRLVQETLRSGESGLSAVENGLDIALCRVLPEEGAVEFAGAGLPLLVREGTELRTVAGDRRHIGFTSAKENVPFTENRIGIREDSVFYLFTDGVWDLPGGEDGFGLGRKRLQSILEVQNVSNLEEQGQRIRSALDEYQGDWSRKDDMLIFGFRVRLTKDV